MKREKDNCSLPLVSVIIPAHNRKEQLIRAINCVLQQDYPSIELIVIDDGSKCSLREAKELAERNGQKFVRQTWQGPAAARNHGAKLSSGKWLAFLDSDDLWKSTKISEQISFQRANKDYLISQCEELWIKNGRQISKKKYHAMPNGEAFYPSLKRCVISPSSVILARDLFKEIGGFDERFIVCEDYELWLRITATHYVGRINEALVTKFAGHADQLSRAVPALDRYRVAALLKLLAEPPTRIILTEKQITCSLHEIGKKIDILLAGVKKRDYTNAELYEKISNSVLNLHKYDYRKECDRLFNLLITKLSIKKQIDRTGASHPFY